LTTILDFCLPSYMAHFLLCHKKSPLKKLWLSLLIIVLDFMVFHKSLYLIDTLPCWRNSAAFYEEIEYQTHYECGKTSSNRWPYWTCWVDCANNFELLLIWISFLIGYLIYPWLIFLLQFFNQWNFDTFKVSNEYLLTDYLIYRLWPVINAPVLLPATCLTWQVFGFLCESCKHSPNIEWLLVLLD
jgi:hypothetical protein